MGIGENLNNLLESFVDSDCKLIAVSKTKPISAIKEAYEAGILDFGENKVQELIEKQKLLPAEIRWHMIGHLQSNKVKYIVPFIYMIHSVDSMKLLKEINKQAQNCERIVSILLQIHIAKEEGKFGFDQSELEELINNPDTPTLQHIKIVGLMGIATNTENDSIIRGEFRGLKELMDNLKMRVLPPNFEMIELSMGMSGDFRIAQEEGSTMVRIGSAIFGSRK